MESTPLCGSFLVKFGPRVKKIEVNCSVTPFLVSLEASIRHAMKSDPMMKGHAESGFFLTQTDEKSHLDVEIDESTEFWQVDTERPIELMLHSSTNLVSISHRRRFEVRARATGVGMTSSGPGLACDGGSYRNAYS